MDRDGEAAIFACLPGTAPIRALGEEGWPHGLLVTGISPEHALVVAHRARAERGVQQNEVRPAILRLVEVTKTEIVERVVVAPPPAARISVPGEIADGWPELLSYIGFGIQKQMGVAAPFGAAPVSVHYRDRYLRSEDALVRLNQLLNAIPAGTAVPVQIETESPQFGGQGRGSDLRTPQEINSTWNRVAPGRKAISVSTTKRAPHSRTLTVKVADATWTIDLDEGVTVFPENRRHGRNKSFLVHVSRSPA
jgi:hypothetical protein